MYSWPLILFYFFLQGGGYKLSLPDYTIKLTMTLQSLLKRKKSEFNILLNSSLFNDIFFKLSQFYSPHRIISHQEKLQVLLIHCSVNFIDNEKKIILNSISIEIHIYFCIHLQNHTILQLIYNDDTYSYMYTYLIIGFAHPNSCTVNIYHCMCIEMD